MSHYTVVVCLDDPRKLDEALAPFDENKQVEPYRDYEDGEPHEHWLYSSLKRADEHDRNGTGILPYKPDEIGWSSASSKEPPEVQRRKIAEDAALFRSLSDPITWADIARIYGERYPGDDDPLLVDESGRAYTMSTYNPESKWDWYQVGGRWKGYFAHRAGVGRDELINGQAGVFGSANDGKPMHCDGGLKSALDLDGMRAEKAAEAHKTYAEFHALVAGTPEARPWREFVELLDKPGGYTIDQARREYHSQPRVQAVRDTDFRWHDDVIATFQKPERLYVEHQRAQAVPGYAVLTLDGRWMAPGRMGWFGASSDDEGDRIGYWEAANAYIESLSESTWLIAVDCHI